MNKQSKTLINIGSSVSFAVSLLSGCHTSQQTNIDTADVNQVVAESKAELVLENQSYDQVFESARDVLVDYRFGINRVDASRGVLTSHPKRSVGVVSPWDREQSTMNQEWEDFANQQERIVRIEFERLNVETDISNSLSERESVVVHVAVLVNRVHRPNWRIESESVRLSTHARSRDSGGQLEPRAFRETIGRDVELEVRIMDEIKTRLHSSEG
ncbi:MAG: hypothetical protein P1U42_04325 [Phycisphaerales bacterium]|nr:hypothetical protein [Phycisphaerales bacterium]